MCLDPDPEVLDPKLELEPEPKLRKKVEPELEPKLNNFGSATLVYLEFDS